MIRVISWNIAHKPGLWSDVVASGADIALLQEAPAPPPYVKATARVSEQPWATGGGGPTCAWRTAVAVLNDDMKAEWHEPKTIDGAVGGDFAVSRRGTLCAATVTVPNREPIVFISMYGRWESPHSSTSRSWIYADASVHRVISDLSVFIGKMGHRIVAAGDLNILHGYGEGGSDYWGARYQTVFDRFAALGLDFVGPQAPNGRAADPWPGELPADSQNVPTYFRPGKGPATATRQLDFVFASTSLVPHVRATALNHPEEWGGSDHCQILIEID